MMKKSIWMFHLLNDYSGSPLVLKNSILALKDNSDITLCTSNTDGFLSSLGVNEIKVEYRWSPIKFFTLFNFIWTNFKIFLIVVYNKRKIDLVYVNTLLPFGAAMAAKLSGIKVIYHMHEPQVNPPILFSFLLWGAEQCATKAIFVSEYLKNCFPGLEERGVVVYNVMNSKFIENIIVTDYHKRSTVLMLCSFKEYKGIYDFVELAKKNPSIQFELVLNSQEVEEFKFEHSKVLNLSIFSSTNDVHQHYKKAKILLNLSHPDKWIESFGMTVLEAASYGIPCIVPVVGGIAEIVNDDFGFRIDHHRHSLISERINEFFRNEKYYECLAKNALKISNGFCFSNYKRTLNTVI